MESTKMTTRIPKTLKDGLDAEAKALGISLNELCLEKLSKPLSVVTEDVPDVATLLSVLAEQNTQLLVLVQQLNSASIMPGLALVEDASTLPADDEGIEAYSDELTDIITSQIAAPLLGGLTKEKLRDKYNLSDSDFCLATQKMVNKGYWQAVDSTCWERAGSRKNRVYIPQDRI